MVVFVQSFRKHPCNCNRAGVTANLSRVSAELVGKLGEHSVPMTIVDIIRDHFNTSIGQMVQQHVRAGGVRRLNFVNGSLDHGSKTHRYSPPKL